jgi:hypothetical protein
VTRSTTGTGKSARKSTSRKKAQPKGEKKLYDVFLSHSSEDKAAVELSASAKAASKFFLISRIFKLVVDG